MNPLSTEILLSIGRCCGNTRQNCPYYPKYEKGNTMTETLKVRNTLENLLITLQKVKGDFTFDVINECEYTEGGEDDFIIAYDMDNLVTDKNNWSLYDLVTLAIRLNSTDKRIFIGFFNNKFELSFVYHGAFGVYDEMIYQNQDYTYNFKYGLIPLKRMEIINAIYKNQILDVEEKSEVIKSLLSNTND